MSWRIRKLEIANGIERTAPAAEEMERVQQWPKIRQQLAEAKAYVSLGGQPAEQSHDDTCSS